MEKKGVDKGRVGCPRDAVTFKSWRPMQGLDSKWVVPSRLKDLLLGKLLVKFEYPSGSNMAKRKSYGLTTMGTAFKNFKGNPWRNYYLKG
uniref:Uncharacterized protein n=1 Tax=Arundo donax TaxID=35708 RepID=A0A0A8Z8L8_ARUDO